MRGRYKLIIYSTKCVLHEDVIALEESRAEAIIKALHDAGLDQPITKSGIIMTRIG